MLDENVISKLMQEHSIWGVLIVEIRSRKIYFSNNKASYMLACSIEDINSRLISEFIPAEKESLINTDFFLYDGFYGEVYLRRAQETLFPVQAHIKLVKNGDIEYSLLSFQDISVQKKMQRDMLAKNEGLNDIMKELVEKNKELLMLDKAKDKFISLVAHELRTPLTTIVSTADIIYHKIYDSEEEFKELAKNLYEQTNQMYELVNDILDLTKIQSGRLDFFISELDPSITIEKQVKIFTSMAETKSIRILFNRPQAAVLCFFDPVRLDQIVGNLISNAIKFNGSGGEVRIELALIDEEVQISIADNGIGIPENKFSAIFNEFETIENISNHHKGTGLGLPIVKRLVEAQGGKITLKSELGKGTTFFVSLPTQKILNSDLYRKRVEESGFQLF
jgi:signal transduction histidine kinase